MRAMFMLFFMASASIRAALKNKMRNAVTMVAEWQMSLPSGERPEYTEGYEGFYHTLRIEGGTDTVEIDMILRDHDKQILENAKLIFWLSPS